MRSRFAATRLVSLLVLALVISGCASTQSPQETVVTTQPAAVVPTPAAAVAVAIPSELVTLHPGLVRAWQGTDPMALKVYFTNEATVLTPEEKYVGWDDIHKNWLTPSLPAMSAFTVTPASFTRDVTEAIIETGSYSFKLTKEGKVEDISGTYTQRWQKQPDGAYRIVSIDVK